MTRKAKIEAIHDVITEEVTRGTVTERIARRLNALGVTEMDFIDIVCGPKAVLSTQSDISCNTYNCLHDIEKGYVFDKKEKPVYRKSGRNWK